MIIRNKNHLKFIRSLPCCVCPKTDIVAAHIRIGTDGGMGLKPSDCYVVPLCNSCHRNQHNIGERSFWGNVEKAKALALSLYDVTGQYEAAVKLVRGFFRSKL